MRVGRTSILRKAGRIVDIVKVPPGVRLDVCLKRDVRPEKSGARRSLLHEVRNDYKSVCPEG